MGVVRLGSAGVAGVCLLAGFLFRRSRVRSQVALRATRGLVCGMPNANHVHRRCRILSTRVQREPKKRYRNGPYPLWLTPLGAQAFQHVCGFRLGTRTSHPQLLAAWEQWTSNALNGGPVIFGVCYRFQKSGLISLIVVVPAAPAGQIDLPAHRSRSAQLAGRPHRRPQLFAAWEQWTSNVISSILPRSRSLTGLST